MLSRRGLLLGLGAALAAPAIVKASSLMPLRGEPLWPYGGIYPWGEHYVAIVHPSLYRDLQLFRDGDLLYNGAVIRSVIESQLIPSGVFEREQGSRALTRRSLWACS